MQQLQTELKIQIEFASQATPSPRAKATMETLDRAKTDLIINYDSVVRSLKQLNRTGGHGRNNGNNNGEIDQSVEKPVDKEVQNQTSLNEKNGESILNLFISILNLTELLIFARKRNNY